MFWQCAWTQKTESINNHFRRNIAKIVLQYFWNWRTGDFPLVGSVISSWLSEFPIHSEVKVPRCLATITCLTSFPEHLCSIVIELIVTLWTIHWLRVQFTGSEYLRVQSLWKLRSSQIPANDCYLKKYFNTY